MVGYSCVQYCVKGVFVVVFLCGLFVVKEFVVLIGDLCVQFKVMKYLYLVMIVYGVVGNGYVLFIGFYCFYYVYLCGLVDMVKVEKCKCLIVVQFVLRVQISGLVDCVGDMSILLLDFRLMVGGMEMGNEMNLWVYWKIFFCLCGFDSVKC